MDLSFYTYFSHFFRVLQYTFLRYKIFIANLIFFAWNVPIFSYLSQ